MKSSAKFKFCLTRLVMLLLCLWTLAPQAKADVTIWVYGTNAPHLQYWNATATNVTSGDAMTSYEYQGTTWYYTVLEGVNSCSIAFDNNGEWGGQTDDITNVSGTRYYYYNGNGRYVDLTDIKDSNSFVFVDKTASGTSYWNDASAVTKVYVWNSSGNNGWPGTAIESSSVGKMSRGGNNIYAWKSSFSNPTQLIITRCDPSSGGLWNQTGDLTYKKGGLYIPTVNSTECYQGVQIGNVSYPTSVPVTDTYTVTGIASPTEGGSVSPASTADLETGNTVTLTATPATGYQFTGWTVSGTSNYTENGNSIQVTVESSNVTVTANFALIPNDYTIHVIEYYANQPNLYAWDNTGELNGSFPGAQMTTTETSTVGETWYKTTLSSTASTISAIASLGSSANQTGNINDIAPGDYYIVFNGTTKETIYTGTTMPEGKVQYQAPHTATVYVYDTTAPTLNGEAMTTEDGRYCVWYKGTVTNTSTLTANIAGSGTLSATLQDGETYYYYWNGTSYVATDIDYNPWANNSITIYVGTKNADESFVPYLYLWYYIGNSKKEPKGSFVTGSNVNNNLMILNQTTEINGQKYWYETFTGIEKLNAIVHNNAGVQTADITNITADRYIIFNPTKSTGSQPYYNESVPKPAKKTFTVHVIDKNGKTPNLYVWDKDLERLNGDFPGYIPSKTETINGETWYKQTFQADDYINVIVSNNSQNQTADITEWTDADLYITYDGNAAEQADRVVYKAATAPTEQQQTHYNYVIYVNNVREPQTSPNVYVYVNTGNQNVPLNGEWNQEPVFGGNASDVSETLADGNLYWKTTINTIYSPINIQFSINGDNQSGLVNGNIQQTDEVGYYKYYSGDDDSGDRYEVVNDLYLYTGEMYVIGKVAGNPWAANAGLKMTAEGDGIFTLNNVQIIADAQFAFASKLGSDENDWAGLNRYRLTSAATGDWWGVTNAMTDKTNPQALPLVLYVDADKNFKMDETAYYNISLNLPARTVTITRAQDALYMFYGNSESPYWKPNAGVPMISTDGITYTLTGVELNAGDTFQFTKQLSNSDSDWSSIAAYRLGADALGDYWEVTAEEIGIVLENALLLGSTKNFQMDPGTAGNYRVVVNPTAETVALYPMADVASGKVIIHLEKTSNVEDPKIWAYDKERNKENTAYIHVDRPSRHEIATNRRVLYLSVNNPNVQPTIVTIGGREWWTWEVSNAIADFWFTRTGFDYSNTENYPETDSNMTDINWRRSGEIFLTWPSTGTTMEDYTRDYYTAAAQEAAECAVMIEGHKYAYFTNTPGWNQVFCHAWATNDQGVNYDLLKNEYTTGNSWYPGALCEMVGYDKDGYEVWRIDLTAHGVTDEPVGIIFNNGLDNLSNNLQVLIDYATGQEVTDGRVKEQTGDFVYSTGACYDYCGVIVLGRSLGNIIRNGVVDGPVYTIEDDIVGVWFDPNAETEIKVGDNTYTMYGALYCKDMNNFVSTPYVEKSIQNNGEIDYVLQRTSLMSGKGRYDQSNWVKLTLSTQYPGVLGENGVLMSKAAQLAILSLYEGFVLPAKSVRGQLVNNVNPEMRLALQALPESNVTNNYKDDPNVFITANFIGTQECEEPADEFGHVHRNTYFFVTPKPQEYAKITWAVYGYYNGNYAFYVPKHGSYAYVEGQYEFMNEGNLDGYFPVQWDLQPNPGLAVNQAYSFRAIIRLADESQATSTPSDAPLRDGEQSNDIFKPYNGTVPYVVSPIDISADNIITAVSDVTKTKTVKQVRYYNLTGMESSEPFDGVNVVVTTYTDGTKSTAKVLK